MKGEYVDFVSLLHENSTASPTTHDLLTLTVNGESLPISFRGQRRAKKVPIDSFDRWLLVFSVFSTVLLSTFPHQAVEMFSYLNIIQSTHKKFLGLSWLAYDIDFEQNPPPVVPGEIYRHIMFCMLYVRLGRPHVSFLPSIFLYG